MIPDHLFVFGTLLSGYDHPMSRLLSQRAELLGEAHCTGQLYLVRHYPGMVSSTDGADQVFGELYRMRDAAELLRVLDEYEGCSEKHPKPHEYVRARVAVTTGDGATCRPGPTSTTAPSRTCPASPPGDFWSIEAHMNAPSPLAGEGM